MFKEGERMLNRAIDQSTFKRIVYAAYLIASADGDFDADEKAALVRLINKDFPDFNTQDVINIIQECDSKVEFDITLGTQEMLDEIAKSNDTAEDARKIMNVCAFIGKADGEYDRTEQVMARRICKSLKLDTVTYDI